MEGAGASPSRSEAPYTGRATFAIFPDELALFAKCRFQGEPTEIERYRVPPALFEADAIAQPESRINPVDLGTVLVPNDWLLLGGRQKGSVPPMSQQHELWHGSNQRPATD